jgi:MinD superfamily P-loop ATPase
MGRSDYGKKGVQQTMRWVVISGKGGTGKTMITSSFAALSDETWCMMDADTEAANLALLFPQGKRVKHHEFIGGEKAVIKQNRCVGCGACQSVCPQSAITVQNGRFVVEPIFCQGCGLCGLYCEHAAIQMEEAQTGQIYEDQIQQGVLVHARLFPGEVGSRSLVHRLRQIAEPKALNLLIDGPPGMGSSVIASLTGCHLAIVVMEPSLSGVSDGFRSIELAKQLDIPVCIIINKWNLNEKIEREIAKRAELEDILIAGIIPFDPIVFQALREAKPVVEMEDSPANRAIRAIWKRLLTKHT